MSDDWGHYFADMGGKPASIAFDDGISAEIGALRHPNSLKLKIELRETVENGLPTELESDRLIALDDAIEAAVTSGGGVYLGRVTNKGVRWVMTLAPSETNDLEVELKRLATEAGYEMKIIIEPDPKKLIYWEDLYPTEDDRRVMGDMGVLRALEDKGDIASKKRPIDHWTYFDREAAARDFARWLEKKRYTDVRVEKQKDGFFSKPRWCVRSVHLGAMLLNDISHHTLAHARQAKKLGGKYDGWETPVMKSKD